MQFDLSRLPILSILDNKMYRYRQQGVTLLEASLATVIGVSIAVSMWGMYNVYVEDMKIQRTKLILNTIRASISFYRDREGEYPDIGTLSSNNMGLHADENKAFYGDRPNTAGSNPFPVDPFLKDNSVSGTIPDPNTTNGGWYYNQATGNFRIDLYDAKYGVSGTIKTLVSNPSSW